MECSPEIIEYTDQFVKTIERVKRRHDPVVTTMAQGILEYKEHLNSPLIDTEVQRFLDRFYMSRIGIRMLIGNKTKKKGEESTIDNTSELRSTRCTLSRTIKKELCGCDMYKDQYT